MISKVMPHDDVPVVVDSVKTYEYFPMARCNYLSVECDSPTPGWVIELGGDDLPFMMLGLVGIVTRPFASKRFNNIGLIEDLFKRIEDEAGLFVDVDDIWLPMFLFDRTNLKPETGQVYRIKSNVFAWALAFREGRLDLKTFNNRCKRLKRPLVLSEDEIGPFREWRDLQVQNAIKQYPKSRKFELSWRE
jgi:hypothetical protein